MINNHTRASLVGKFPTNAQIVKEGVAFSFGNGPDLYVVTDPECPFCRRVLNPIDNELWECKECKYLFEIDEKVREMIVEKLKDALWYKKP